MLTMLQYHDYWSYYLRTERTERLLSKILHSKHLFVKLGMVWMRDECFPFHCCFTRELGKQIAILERALHELKIFWPWDLKDVKCHVQFSLWLTVNRIGGGNWLCLE